MCIILAITKPQLITVQMLNNCAASNPDSVGISYIEKGKIVTHKSLNVSEGVQLFTKAVKNQDKGTGILMHYRIATSGKIDCNTQHPFNLCNNTLSFAHNGIISGLGDKKRSDTQELVSMLDAVNIDVCNSKHIELLQYLAGHSNKFAILDIKGNLTIINSKLGIYEGGNWFSNRTYKYESFYSGNLGGYNRQTFAGKTKAFEPISQTSRKYCKVCFRTLGENEKAGGYCLDCLADIQLGYIDSEGRRLRKGGRYFYPNLDNDFCQD